MDHLTEWCSTKYIHDYENITVTLMIINHLRKIKHLLKYFTNWKMKLKKKPITKIKLIQRNNNVWSLLCIMGLELTIQQECLFSVQILLMDEYGYNGWNVLSAKQTCEMCKGKMSLQSNIQLKHFNLFSEYMHMIAADSDTMQSCRPVFWRNCWFSLCISTTHW